MRSVEVSHVTLSRSEAEARGPKPYRSTAGFTLIEVLLALVIAGSAALLAHALFSAAVDGSRDLRLARAALDRDSNVRRFLDATFLSVETGTSPFTGDPDQMRFTAWVPTSDGWFEPRDILLSLHDRRLVATGLPPRAIVLADSVTDLGLDYLVEPGAQARWVGGWVSPVSAPLAVRIRVTRERQSGAAVTDTTIYLIRARG
jgi:prepilin-type N-terminal cleavage/methylation domain-containing protein